MSFKEVYITKTASYLPNEPVSNDEIRFAEERLKMHEENPLEGMSLASFKKYFADKYGF